MADYYWTHQTNHGTGNYSNINMWASSTGGVGGTGAVPTSSDNAHFDAGSFDLVGQTVTVDVNSYCNDINWTGATNSPTFYLADNFQIYGSVTFILSMFITRAGGTYIAIRGTSVGSTFKSNGLIILENIYFLGTGTYQLQDDLVMNQGGNNFDLDIEAGTLDTNGHNITCEYVTIKSSTTRLLTSTGGVSTINCMGWQVGGSNATITASIFTINDSGDFAGGDITTYYIVNLTGATCSYSGNNTFSTITLVSGTAQTITFAAGATITCNTAANIQLSGDGTHQHTLTGAATWYISCSSNTISVSYVTFAYSTAQGGATWNSYITNGCVDNGNNNNWNFTPPGGGALSVIPLGFILGG
jgi:hypothetical protein